MTNLARAAFAAAAVSMFLAGALPAHTALRQADPLEELSWLVGEWQRPTRSGLAIERWKRTEAGLVGEGAALRDGEERHTEALLLVAMGAEVFYIAKPPENSYPVAFRLVARAGGAFEFENPTHDFPQRIIYRRTADDAMTASIEGPGDDEQVQRIDFAFTRR